MNFFNVQSPFFRPLWRRIAVVALTLGWAVFEVIAGSVFWAILFGAAGLYCAHQFFIAFNVPEGDETETDG